MSTFSISPRLLRGALIGFELTNRVASVAIFQYNPDSLTRTLQAQTTEGESGNRSEPQRLKGPPVESIRMDIEIDASDQLESGDANTVGLGIYPQLSALEMLLYPKASSIILNSVLLSTGILEVVPVEGPFTLLVWGPKRVLPIRLTEFSITEEAYDPNLNPIRAKVSLGLRVLSTSDFPIRHPGFSMFMSHQVIKEAMAVVGSIGNTASFGVNLV